MNRTSLNPSANFSKQMKASPYNSTFTKTVKLRNSQIILNKENISFNTKNNPIQPSHVRRNSTHQRRLSLAIDNKENNPKAFNNNANKNPIQKQPLAIKGRSKSVSKQRSVDLKSPLESEVRLMQPKYDSPLREPKKIDTETDLQLGNLKKSITDQEMALQNLKKQIELEKSTISQLGHRAHYELSDCEGGADNDFHSDKSNTVPFSTQRETSRSSDLEEILQPDKHSSAAIKSVFKVDSKTREETFGYNYSYSEESHPCNLTTNQLATKHYRRGSEMQQTEAANYSSMKGLLAENQTLKNQVENYKTLLKTIKEKYDTEVQVLKKSLEALTQENFKLRFEVNMKKEDSKKFEEVLRTKVLSLEDELRCKNAEFKQSAAMKGQLDDMHKKMVKLQVEIQKNTQLEERIKELNYQVSFKEGELQSIKKNFSEMHQAKSDEQAKQKKEWSKIYRELLNEIGVLKTEIDVIHRNKRSMPENPDSSRRSNDSDGYYD